MELSDKQWLLITRILSEEASPAEQAEFNAWMNSRPDHEEWFDEIKSRWNDIEIVLPDYDKRVAYQQVIARIRRSEVAHRSTSRSIRLRKTRNVSYKVAASWLFIAMLSLSGVWYARTLVNNEPEWRHIANGIGERTQIVLPDSSVVWLNAQSTLRYPTSFPPGQRDVELSGEAFFEVRKDSKAPFSVITNNLRTTVLGTSFNINADQKTKEVLIAVLTGKVSVLKVGRRETQQLGLLKPNEQLAYYPSSNSFRISTTPDAYAHAAWKDGVLRFSDMNFEAIAKKLEDWYGVTIVFQDEALRRCQLEGTFHNVPLEKVIKMLSMTAGFNYTIAGDSITVSGHGCY